MVSVDRLEVPAVAQPGISASLIATMAVGSGIAVANTWYNQPMLADMARSLHCAPIEIGYVTTVTQIGYAVGMPVFLPLGDMVERRGLVVGLFVAVGCALVGAALATGLTMLVVASFFIGLTTVIAQILIPAATELAPPSIRGKVVGKMMTGVLLGILLARTLSGFISQHFGWRSMFWLAAGMAWMMAAVLRMRLPLIPVQSKAGYRALIGSIRKLIMEHPRLLQISSIAALFFASFSAFWTTLVFLLETPAYHLGSQAAGLFGLVGAISALVAPMAGHVSDRRGSRYVVSVAAVGMFVSFGIFWAFGFHIWGLIAGVVLLDAGVQAAQVANQSSVFAIRPEASSRLNTVYMLLYFGGASLGSFSGSWAWNHWQWPGVCFIGIVFTAMATSMLFAGSPYRSGTK